VIVTWPPELPDVPPPPLEPHAVTETTPATASAATADARFPIFFMGTFYVDGAGVATLTLHGRAYRCNIRTIYCKITTK
jgi:hypothetical protein